MAGGFRDQGELIAATSGENSVPLARLERSAGVARISFKCREGGTVLDTAHQSGCSKVRFPAPLDGRAPEAVLINTGGGLTDGDHIATHVHWKEGTCAAITTQAAERVYRSRGGPAQVINTLKIADGATGLWLPQETILFDGGRLKRRLEAEIAEGGRLLACESLIFGRTAMGETVEHGALTDIWRLRYGGRLVFADGFHLEGNIAETLARPAVARGAAAIASIIYAGGDAAAISEVLRPELMGLESESGCSVIGPVLVIRVLAHAGSTLRRDLVRTLGLVLQQLDALQSANTNKAPVMLPRTWFC